MTSGIKNATDMIMEQVKEFHTFELNVFEILELSVVRSPLFSVSGLLLQIPRKTDARRGRSPPGANPGQRNC